MDLRKVALTVAAGASLGVMPSVYAAETTFVGYTNGCFSLTCPPPTSSALQTATIGGLTYGNSNFDVTTVLGLASLDGAVASPNVDNLGSFSLATSPLVYTGNTFDLRVTFTAPSGTTPVTSVFTADVIGTIIALSDSLTIDFVNTAHAFTFDNGTFNFFVNDIVGLTPGSSIALSGRFDTNVNAVPEPETSALIMAGLAAFALISRRRKR